MKQFDFFILPVVKAHYERLQQKVFESDMDIDSRHEIHQLIQSLIDEIDNKLNII